MKYILTFLLVFFAIEDLIGKKNVGKFEAQWLESTTSIFESWQSAVRQSFSWWRPLILLINILLASALNLILLLKLFKFIALLFPGPKSTVGFPGLKVTMVLFLRYCFKWGALLVVAGGAALTQHTLLFYVKHFLRPASNIKSPVEISCLRFLIIPIENYSFSESGLRETAAEGFILVVLIVLTALVAPILILPIIGLKFSLLLIAVLVWILIFAPSKVLKAIANRTGGESYVKVGKYIVAVVGLIWAWF